MSGMWRRTCASNGTPRSKNRKTILWLFQFPEVQIHIKYCGKLRKIRYQSFEEVRKYMNGIKKKAEGEKYGIDGIIKAKKNLPEI